MTKPLKDISFIQEEDTFADREVFSQEFLKENGIRNKKQMISKDGQQDNWVFKNSYT